MAIPPRKESIMFHIECGECVTTTELLDRGLDPYEVVRRCDAELEYINAQYDVLIARRESVIEELKAEIARN
jgi:hypothetical protein